MKPLHRQIATFATVGVIATFVHVVVGVGLNRMAGASPLMANLIAFAAATCVTLFSNSRFTFKGHQDGASSFVKGLITVLIGLALNQLIVLAITGYAALPYEVALIAVVIIVPFATFLLFKFWAFRT